MEPLLGSIESYWTKRSESYSDVVRYEMSHENESNWFAVIEEQIPKDKALKVLDIGTGPGFFAVGFASRGYQVTAVDYTQAMLEEAKKNAGELASKITFLKMDAHKLEFADNSFDVIVSRNLTWNLERPQDAYKEWHRVLKPHGILLNFDAGWYSYLYNAQDKQMWEETQEEVQKQGVFDFNGYEEAHLMEKISKQLLMSRCKRPQVDVDMLLQAEFEHIYLDTKVWERVWDSVEKVNFAATPMFMIRASK